MATEIYCSVNSCSSTSRRTKHEKLLFFPFPKDFEVKKEWIIRCHRDSGFDPETARICSKHFTPEDYEDKVKAQIMGLQPKILQSSAVPSLDLHPALSEAIKEFELCKRAKERKELVEKLLEQDSAYQRTRVHLKEDGLKNSEPKNIISKNEQVKVLPEPHYVYVPQSLEAVRLHEPVTIQTNSSDVEVLRKTIRDLEERNNKLERDLEASNAMHHLLNRKLSESERNRETLESKVAVLETLLKESVDDFDWRWKAVSEMEKHYQELPKDIAGNFDLLDKTVAFISSKILELGVDIKLIEAFCKKKNVTDESQYFVKSTKTSLNDASPKPNKKAKKVHFELLCKET